MTLPPTIFSRISSGVYNNNNHFNINNKQKQHQTP